MPRKQLIALLAYSLIGWTIGNGLSPILPVYAVSLGADSSFTGLYMSLAYLALFSGTLGGGWLSGKFQRRKLMMFTTSFASVPVIWAMGRIDTVWALCLLTAVLWLLGGMGLMAGSILAGLSAGAGQRGKVFGMLAMTGGLGALLGGLGIGRLVDLWGFSVMFSALAVLQMFNVGFSFMPTDRKVAMPRKVAKSSARPARNLNYNLLLLASLLASTGGFAVVLGRSLVMRSLGFSATAITSTVAVGGLVTMPLPFIMGWLSDKAERKTFLYAGYGAGIFSLVVLAYATALWHFCLAVALLQTFTGLNKGIGNAMVTDMLPDSALSQGLARFGATVWLGGIIGFLGTGVALQNYGVPVTVGLGLALSLMAFAILLRLKPSGAATTLVAEPVVSAKPN